MKMHGDFAVSTEKNAKKDIPKIKKRKLLKIQKPDIAIT